MRVIVLGHDYFSMMFYKDYSSYLSYKNMGRNHLCYFKKLSIKSVIKFLQSEIIWVMGGSLNLADGPRKFLLIVFSLLFRKKVIVYWLGSDSMNVQVTNGFFNKYI